MQVSVGGVGGAQLQHVVVVRRLVGGCQARRPGVLSTSRRRTTRRLERRQLGFTAL